MVQRLVIFSFLLGLVSGRSIALPGSYASSSCRSIPGDAAWPSTEKWDALNKTVNGRLIATVPIPSVCHLKPFGNYNEDSCAAVQKAWLNDEI